jgi:hypothetical protein
MAVNIRSRHSKKVAMKIMLRSIPPFLLLLCLCAPSEKEEGIAKYLRDSEFVAHGRVGPFGTGLDGSLVNIGFTIREMLKGSYTGTEVKFDLPPGASGGVKAFEFFQKHGHDYIICFKKGAQEGKYEYCGPKLDSPEIVANGANVAKAKAIIRGTQTATITWFDTVVNWWILVAFGFALIAVTIAVSLVHIIRKRRAQGTD